MWPFARLITVLVVGVIAALHAMAGFAANVDSVRLWRAPDHTRLVFDLSGPVQHKLFTLDNPSRLVVDLERATLNTRLGELDLSNSPVKSVRSARHNTTDVRVVLELSGSVKPRSFFLPKHGDNRDRLVIDLFDQSPQTAQSTRTISKVAETSGKRDIIIAIDAGHGGEDPGALGPVINGRKLREKDVVMAISKELAQMINQVPGYRAELVRTGDYFIPLKQRRDIARNKRADLFVSIHADAFTHPRANGASVFALSRSGATSETARFLAQKENDSDLIGGVGSVSLDDKDELLRGVLVDLSMTATLSSSLQVGGQVLKSMGSVARLHKNHVEQAGFLVLKSPDVPSILVETGFISNPGEAQKLSTPHYRRQMASSVMKGIRAHFDRYPPAGSYVAAMKNKNGVDQNLYAGADASASSNANVNTNVNANSRSNTSSRAHHEHVISRGETLSAISRRYNVSVQQIIAFNGLASSGVQAGQKIKIPTS